MFKNDEPRCDKKKKKRSKIGAEAVFSAPKFLVLASLLFQYRKSFFFFYFGSITNIKDSARKL